MPFSLNFQRSYVVSFSFSEEAQPCIVLKLFDEKKTYLVFKPRWTERWAILSNESDEWSECTLSFCWQYYFFPQMRFLLPSFKNSGYYE